MKAIVLGLVLAITGAEFVTTGAPAPLPPEVVLARYTHVLEAVRLPTTISFQYTVEQLGGRDIEQTHRVYRSGTEERDETLQVDGEKVIPPSVRFFRGRRDRYAITNVAPRIETYDFKYVGPHTLGSKIDYVFSTTPRTPGAFAVTNVTIDGTRFLPLAVTFRTRQGSVVGTGTITYAASGKYWLPATATASVTGANRGGQERIVFTAYDFPTSLPPGTFGRP